MTDYLERLLREQERPEREEFEEETWREKQTWAFLPEQEDVTLPWGSRGRGEAQSGRQVEAGTERTAPNVEETGTAEKEGTKTARRQAAGEESTEEAGEWAAYHGLVRALGTERINSAARRENRGPSHEEGQSGPFQDGDLGEPQTAGGQGAELLHTQAARQTAEWAYQALRASLTQLPAQRQETRVMTLQRPENAGGAGGWDPEGLDRMLRRDARRFDGGFQLL